MSGRRLSGAARSRARPILMAAALILAASVSVSAQDSRPLAEVNGEAILADELDRVVAPQLAKLQAQIESLDPERGEVDTDTGAVVAQFAYQMEGSSQGRGISALVALNDHAFLVLERNNRGIGVGAEISPPNKKVYRIDLDDAADMSDVTFAAAACPAGKVSKSGPVLDLAANTLTELGNKVPEKWEGLAIGPQLRDGRYLMLAGTDNGYSVTQNASGDQSDVYFRFTDADPFAGSIQCPIGEVTGCFHTSDGTPTDLTPDYRLLPGVLHAYKVPASDLGDYVAPVPPLHKP